MAHRVDDLQQDIADTQQDIADTRSAMTEKLELLGERVRETVEDAQASVEEMVENVRDTVDTTVAAVKQGVEGAQASMEGIVENVKGTVEETVEAVQRPFDLYYQVEQHPWLLFGGATVVGYLLGRGGNGHPTAPGSVYDPRFSAASAPPVSSSESSAPTQPQPETGSGVLEQFKNEITIIKGAAVGAVVSTLWGMVKQVLLSTAPPSTSDMTKGGAQPSESSAQTSAALSSTTVNGSAIL